MTTGPSSLPPGLGADGGAPSGRVFASLGGRAGHPRARRHQPRPETAASAVRLLNIYGRQNEELTEALRLTRSLVGVCGAAVWPRPGQPPSNARAAPHPPLPASADARPHPLGDLGADPNLARSMTLYGDLTDRYGLLEDDAYAPQAPDEPYAQAWEADRDAQLAAAVTAEMTYENLEPRQELYEQLTTELDNRDSVKETLDILAHMTAENGRLLMELIRVQAAATQAASTAQLAHQTHEARIRRMADYENLRLEDW